VLDQSCFELFRECIVRIKTPKNRGTGFFVAPGQILTCNHVIAGAKDDEIEVLWKEAPLTIVSIARTESGNPDLALLKVTLTEHPCVYLDREVQPNDALYSYGYPPKYEGGFSVNPLCVGPTDQGCLLTIRDENIQPGLSGAPLLNLRTSKVCGLIKSERSMPLIQNVLRALGGQAIPTQVIFDRWNGLESNHDGFHYRDARWRSLIPKAIGEIIFGRRLFTFLSRVGVRVDPLPFNKDIPQPIALQSPLNLPPPRPDLLGRKAELEDAAFALKREGKEKTVGFYGKPGVGKSMLLEDFAHHEIVSDFPDGVVHLAATRFCSETDLLEEIFYRFNEKIRGIKFSFNKIKSTLQAKKILVLLDDVKLSADQIIALRQAIAKSAFVFTWEEGDRLKRGERAIELKGFSEDDVFDLVAQEQAVGRPLTLEERAAFTGERRWSEFLTNDEDRQAATSLLKPLNGHPWQIRQAIKLARSQNQSLKEIAEVIKQDPSAIALTQRRIQSLPEPARRILKLLAVLGVAGAGLLIAISRADSFEIPKIEEYLNTLSQQDLIQVSESQYRLTSNVSEIINRETDLIHVREAALDYFKQLVEDKQIEPDVVFQDADAISNILQWAFDSGRYADVVKLGQGVEAALAFNGLWGAWERVLRWELQSSQALNDWGSGAWALHQLGTRALCLGNNRTARSCLTQALTLRESLGDVDGANVTRHNLGLLAPLPIVSHLIPPITVGTIAALFLLSFWLIPDSCPRGTVNERFPLLNWLTQFFPESCPIQEPALKIPPKPEPLEATPCVIQGTEEFIITQTQGASGDTFSGEISYLLRGKPRKTLVSGTLTESGWFSLKSIDPKPDECFITLDGEQIRGLPPSQEQGEIVGGASADEVLLNEETKKIKIDKSQGASGAFRMLEQSPGTWVLEIPSEEEFRLKPSPKPSSGPNSDAPPQSPVTVQAEPETESNSESNQIQAVSPITTLPPIASIPAQDLRVALNIAVNNEDWGSAIEIVDRMLENASPQEVKNLQEYRVVLQNRLAESSTNP
jgi:hypothetical protein